MRKLFYFILLLFVCVKCYAQADTATLWLKHDTVAYYMQNNYVIADTKEDAKFLRLIIKADSGLYRIEEYYMNSRPKLLALSYNRQMNYQRGLQGLSIEYYPTRFRKKESYYKKGKLNGYERYYYPNGKLNSIKEYRGDSLYLAKCLDTAGKVLADNGSGTWLLLNEDGNGYWKGAVVNGLAEGKWKQHSSNGTSEVIYKHGKVLVGIPPLKFDRKEYSPVVTTPDFPGGSDGLTKFIYRNLRYPENAKKNNVQGTVVVSFIVETDGSLSSINVKKSADYDLDQEAIRVLLRSPRWTPGKDKDGNSVPVQYSIPLNFALTEQMLIEPYKRNYRNY